MSKKLNISLSDAVVERLNNFAEKKGVSKSSVIAMSLNTYIDAQEQLPVVASQLDELSRMVKDLEMKNK